MRLLDLKLTEADLSIGELTSKPETDLKKPTKYLRVNILIQKIIAGQPHELSDGTEVIVKKSEAKRLMDLFNQPTKPRGSLILATDRGLLSISKFFKSEDIGGQSGGIKSEKVSNRGEIAEGLLGASLLAKLKARMSGKIEIIDGSDIWAVIDSLNVQKLVQSTGKTAAWGEYGVSIKDQGKKVVNDTIKYTMKLKQGPFSSLMDPAKRLLLQDLISSAVEYANSPDAQTYSEYFYLNGKPDVIHVITDGISESTTKKTDIEVVVTDPITGKVTHQQLNISLKAGSDQIGQVGQGEKGQEFESQKKLWNAFGIDIESSRAEFNRDLKKKDLIFAIEGIYRDAAEFLNDLLAGSFDDAEYLFLKDLVKGIDYYATLNDPTVLLVNLEKGGYDVLSFANLRKQLKNIDLAAKFREKVGSPPQIEIFDSNTGVQLLKIRTKRETKDDGSLYIRNYIEKGPLLKQLTSIKR